MNNIPIARILNIAHYNGNCVLRGLNIIRDPPTKSEIQAISLLQSPAPHIREIVVSCL